MSYQENIKKRFDSLLQDIQINSFIKEDNMINLKDDSQKKIKKKLKKQEQEILKLSEKQNVEDLKDLLFKTLTDLKVSRQEYLQNGYNYMLTKNDSEKVIEQVQKQKNNRDNLQKLYDSLLQKNSQIIEDHKENMQKQNQLRNELTCSFQQRVQNIQQNLEQLGQEKLQLLNENQMLKDKYREIDVQFEKREVLFNMQIEKKGLENKLMENKFQVQLNHIEQENSKIDEYRNQYEQLSEQNKIINEKSQIYQNKADQFQDIMIKSNNGFKIYKKQFEDINLTTSKLEQNNRDVQINCEKQDIQMVQMIEEYQIQKQEINKIKQQIKNVNQLKETLQKQLEQKKLENSQINDSNKI